MRLAVAAMVLAAAPGTVAAQQAANPATAPTPGEQVGDASEIEVLAKRRLEAEQVREGVREVGTPRAFTDVVPRYHEAVCPKVVGVDAKVARFMEARISAVADFVELPKPNAQCLPNAVVLILDEPAAMFDQLRKKRAGLVGPVNWREPPLSLFRGDLASGKPIVALNAIEVRNYDGPTLDTSFIPGLGGDLGGGPPVIVSPTTSRLRSSTFLHKYMAVVVIDKKQLADVEALQLADLAALYLLGTPRRNIDFDAVQAPTLLSLFRNGAKASTTEMTDFDRAYLKGIYSLRPNGWFNWLKRSVAAAYEEQCTEENALCAVASPAAEGK